MESPASVSSGEKGISIATAPLPEDITTWFINVRSGGLVTSSDYQTISEK